MTTKYPEHEKLKAVAELQTVRTFLDWRTQKQQKTATRDAILIMCDMLVSTLIAFLWAWRVAPIGSSVFWNCYAAFFIGSVVNGLFTAVRKASVPLTEKHWAVRLFEEKEADFNRRHPEPIARVEFDGAGQLLRCKVTGNPCGADTRGNGIECPCVACQKTAARAERS